MKKLIKSIFNFFGLDIVRYKNDDDKEKLMNFDFNQEANQLIKIIRPYTMLPYTNLVQLYELVKYCEINEILGDFVECGVWKGGSSALMALGSLNNCKNEPRTLHLFDIFSEICAPDPDKDGERAMREAKKFNSKFIENKKELFSLKGIYDAYGGPGSLSQNQELFYNIIKYPKAKVHFHEGWFQDTLPIVKNEISKIAILRLDGDWYESTKVCLENLYDKVVKGGVIIIDDYGTYEGCKKAVDEFIHSKSLKVFLSYSSSDCRYWIKND